MRYFQKKKQLRQIKSDIDTLCLYKKTLKSVGSLYNGLKFINEQFDMTEYSINELNRSLTIYLGKEDCLKECLRLLHELQDDYIKERKLQTEQFNEFNLQREKVNMPKCDLTTEAEFFIYKYHRAINQLQELVHNTTIKFISRIKGNTVNESFKSYIDKNEINVLQTNSSLYNQFFALENTLRKYILSKYHKNYNDTTLSKWLKQDILDDFSKKKNDENKFGISSRGDNIIYYLDFNVLGKIIENKFKEGFNEDFKRSDDIVPKLNYLYLIRCKVAHNSLCITSDEIKMTEIYISYILGKIYNK